MWAFFALISEIIFVSKWAYRPTWPILSLKVFQVVEPTTQCMALAAISFCIEASKQGIVIGIGIVNKTF
jgi:hypothetical protein